MNVFIIDKLPQAVGYLPEQMEEIWQKMAAAQQPHILFDGHQIIGIRTCRFSQKVFLNLLSFKQRITDNQINTVMRRGEMHK